MPPRLRRTAFRTCVAFRERYEYLAVAVSFLSAHLSHWASRDLSSLISTRILVSSLVISVEAPRLCSSANRKLSASILPFFHSRNCRTYQVELCKSAARECSAGIEHCRAGARTRGQPPDALATKRTDHQADLAHLFPQKSHRLLLCRLPPEITDAHGAVNTCRDATRATCYEKMDRQPLQLPQFRHNIGQSCKPSSVGASTTGGSHGPWRMHPSLPLGIAIQRSCSDPQPLALGHPTVCCLNPATQDSKQRPVRSKRVATAQTESDDRNIDALSNQGSPVCG